MDNRLNIAFFWHMHQPLYRDPFSAEFVLPWVLLHGTKDYLDMVSILDDFPNIHQTFNIVPSLIEQINEYGSGEVKDKYRSMSMKQADSLTEEDKLFLLETFFQANRDNMIKPVERYWELLVKRGFTGHGDEASSAVRYFSTNDYLDLQVLFNLVWIDPALRAADPELSALVKKGRGYSEGDKHTVLSKQIEIIRSVLPSYRRMAEQGVIELTTSPYYHPIMPLLCDTDSARHALPEIKLPPERFSYPEDAAAQLAKAVALHKATFGAAPTGLWPPEGSVSMEILPLILDHGIKWIATDEEILAHTLGKPLARDDDGNLRETFLYRPYSIGEGDRSLSIVFRDHVISDLIGFEYSKQEPEAAATELVARLEFIGKKTEIPSDHIVSIVLDGENAWENFVNDGRDFLSALYSMLSESKTLRCVTIGEFLSKDRATERLDTIFPGSWINHDFSVWIGHEEENAAWDLLLTARKALVEHADDLSRTGADGAERVALAWDEIYAAEGSDWFWWYGDDHASLNDGEFDGLFRGHLKKTYDLIGIEPPPLLDVPVIRAHRGFKPARVPVGFIEPVIDGVVNTYFEWLAAGRLDRAVISGAMHDLRDRGVLIEDISYGFNLDTLFFRLDYLKDLRPFEGSWRFTIDFITAEVKLKATVEGRKSSARIEETGAEAEGGSKLTLTCDKGKGVSIASGQVVELAVPFGCLGVSGGDELNVIVHIDAGDRGVERYPSNGALIVEVPTKHFEQFDWIV